MKEYSTKDILAQAFINVDFPAQYIATMKNEKLSNVGIKDFYHAFCAKNGIEDKEGKNVLFQPALILGYLYTAFLIPQQSFFDNISEENINPEDWGMIIEGNNNNSLKYLLRRLRNAIAHNHIIVSKEMNFVFWDANPSINSIDDAEIIYKFSFDSLMFIFFRKWNDLLKTYFD
jgi:hypothetical protein